MNRDRTMKVLDIAIVFFFLVCVVLTYRSCKPPETIETNKDRQDLALPPTPTPTPTPPPEDLNPERTLILSAMSFFEAISDGRHADAAAMFADAEKQMKWETNLERVKKFGNPIVAFEIEKVFERNYCKVNLKDETKARCDFPILLHRKDGNISTWAAIGMNLELEAGQWKIIYYQQDDLDKDAYDKRKAEQQRKKIATELARQKLSAPDDDTGEVEATPTPLVDSD
jgi:hypothetical protein